MHATLPLLTATDFPPIRRERLETLQINLGYRCNQSCLHCHVNAGPRRKEQMGFDVVAHVVAYLRASGVKTLDITGGAPELNPHFRYLVDEARHLGLRVIDRSNLTILEEPGFADLAGFLAASGVEIAASLPCYLQENVDRQRGAGVHEKSLRALQRLNALGYGMPDSGLVLNLVYNPGGAFLPPQQDALERDYRSALSERYGIVFNKLLTLANMPIERFGSMLISQGQFHDYMRLLKQAHCAKNLAAVMCRSLISVNWQGYVYDCDFNQILGLPLGAWGGNRMHISNLAGQDMTNNPIAIADHCYGCTAGHGSSCGGALN